MLSTRTRYSPLFLALRYSKGRSPFLRFMSFLSVTGIAIGVGALIVVLSIMAGIREEIRDKILGVNPHILIIKAGGVIEEWEKIISELKDGTEGVRDIFPLFAGNAILKVNELTTSVIIQCIPSEFMRSSRSFRKLIRSGDVYDEEKAVIGSVLSKNMGLEIGDRITIISPYGRTTMFGFVPNTTEVEISGIIEVGIFDWDSVFVFLDLKRCDDLFGTRNFVSSVAVMLEDPDRAEMVSAMFREKLGYPFVVLPWTRTQKNFFAAMQLEKIGMTIVLTLIVLVASFNVLSTLAILVRDKSKDIAIMKVFGVPVSDIKKAFLGVGMIIAAKGITLGTILGILLSLIISRYEVVHLPEDVYFVSRLPAKLKIQDILLSWLIALVASFISSTIPVQRAIRKEPFEILRKE